jgi:hypothetical protein
MHYYDDFPRGAPFVPTRVARSEEERASENDKPKPASSDEYRMCEIDLSENNRQFLVAVVSESGKG